MDVQRVRMSTLASTSGAQPGVQAVRFPPVSRHQRSRVPPIRASSPKDNGSLDLNSILSKYGAAPDGQGTQQGVALLISVNVAIYCLAVYGGKAPAVAQMVLSASGAKWWQYMSSAFVHATAEHLIRNTVTVWLAGSLLRRELTNVGVWIAYVMCAVGANLSAMWLMPGAAKAAGGLLGVAATGGAAGLAITALALGFSLSWRYAIAATSFWYLVLGPLIASPVPGGPSAAQPSPHRLMDLVFAGPSGLPALFKSVKGWVNSAAADPGLTWLWGAMAGAALVVLIVRFPDPDVQTQQS